MGSNKILPLNPADFSMHLVEDLGLIYATPNTKERKRHGMFECPMCKHAVRMPIASAKKAKSCFSCRDTDGSTTHGDTNTRLHTVWKNMKARCYGEYHQYYHNYGGRGITVCVEWRESYEAFRSWALQNGYTDELTIDRKDNDLGYSPSNCQFATRMEQTHNRRNMF